jgi:SAM-dependent methyltransferase
MEQPVTARFFRHIHRYFRAQRVGRLYQTLRVNQECTVLDIGGTEKFWLMVAELGYRLPRVTLLNLEAPAKPPDGARFVQGDAGRLPFRDGAFDVVVCNSVIEHLHRWEAQVACAREIQRVGRAYLVQSPDRSFPIEPHFLAPFVHWLPESWRPTIVRWSPWALLNQPSAKELTATVREIRLLSAAEMGQLFPDAEVIRERFCGWSKSLLAVQRRRKAIAAAGERG